MSARIYVDLRHVHPVVDGVWHMADLQRMPKPGEGVTMLCGVTAAAEYEPHDSQHRGPATQCWRCTDAYNRQRRFRVSCT